MTRLALLLALLAVACRSVWQLGAHAGGTDGRPVFGLTRFALLVGCFWGMLALAANACDLALIIASDMSASMKQEGRETVRRGTAAALRHPEVVHALTVGETQVMVVEFAMSTGLVADWTPIRGTDDLYDLAAAVEIGTPPHMIGSATVIPALLQFAAAAFAQMPCDRMVLDIATDGDPHDVAPEAARYLDPERHVVNIIFLNGEEADLRDMHAHTRLGFGGFLIPVTSAEEFPEAMRRKLLMEVS
jgi:Ca-activated chloride channel family protein